MQTPGASPFLPEGRHTLLEGHHRRLVGSSSSRCSARSGAARGAPRGAHSLWAGSGGGGRQWGSQGAAMEPTQAGEPELAGTHM